MCIGTPRSVDIISRRTPYDYTMVCFVVLYYTTKQHYIKHNTIFFGWGWVGLGGVGWGWVWLGVIRCD